MVTVSRRAWPFLVSRNREADYRSLVVHPSFLEKKVSSLLADVAGGAPTPSNSAIYREIHHSPVGDVTLIFRVLLAENRFVDLAESDFLSDRSGRAIRIIEGMVLEGLVPHVTVTEKDFQSVHEAVKPIFQKFWQAGEKQFPVQASQPILLSPESATNPSLKLLVAVPFVKEQPSPVPEKKEDELNQVPSAPFPPRTDEWEKRYQCIKIIIGILLVLLMIGIVVLSINLYVRPIFFPAPTPTLTPTLTH